jgi:hypothetical protein
MRDALSWWADFGGTNRASLCRVLFQFFSSVSVRCPVQLESKSAIVTYMASSRLWPEKVDWVDMMVLKDDNRYAGGCLKLGRSTALFALTWSLEGYHLTGTHIFIFKCYTTTHSQIISLHYPWLIPGAVLAELSAPLWVSSHGVI